MILLQDAFAPWANQRSPIFATFPSEAIDRTLVWTPRYRWKIATRPETQISHTRSGRKSLAPVDFNTRERKQQFTLNLGLRSSKKSRSLGFSSELLATTKTVRNFSSANLSLDHLTILQNDNWVFSSTSTFHLYILSVHVKLHRRGDLLNFPQFYRASFSLRAPSQGPEEFRVNKWITYLKSHLENCLYLSLSTIN